ncbi:unnamed protein product [Orchesella dallaii]|uniref:DUF4806 domain-containing protein n=1 Tax=Orchesella dallaii TaxID=48710 RepID=A0ABP1PYP9_9HEXA
MSKYCVVQFPHEDDAVAVVSSKWINAGNKLCYWPVGPNLNIHRLAKDHANVQPSWPSYPCELKKTCELFENAKSVCKRAEYSSNVDTPSVESDIDGIRRTRKRNHKFQRKNLTPKLVAVCNQRRSPSTSSSSGSYNSDFEVLASSCPTTDLLGAGISPKRTSLGTEQLHTSDVNYGLKDAIQEQLRSQVFSHQSTTAHQFVTNRLHTQASSAEPLDTFFSEPRHDRQQALRERFGQSSSTLGHHGERSYSPEVSTLIQPNSDYTSGCTDPILPNHPLWGLNRNSGFEKVVLEYLVKILENQKELLRRSSDSVNSAPSVSLPVQLPVRTHEEYCKIIDWINDSSNFNSLMAELSIIGGKSIADITNRILDALLSNSVAENLSLTGRGKKTVAGLRGTQLLPLIYATVRCTKGGQGATNCEVDKAIQNWLKGAPDREGGRDYGRNKRQKQCQENVEEDRQQGACDGSA